MFVTIVFVHVEAMSTRHAFAFAKPVVRTFRHIRSAWAGAVRRVATNPIAAVLISSSAFLLA